MAANVLVDTGFLVALVDRRDNNHAWAVQQGRRYPPPWKTCEAVVSEGFHLLGSSGYGALVALLRRDQLKIAFSLEQDPGRPLALMDRYNDVPMSLADACLVRMTETLSDPTLLTTDSDFRVYRRHGRQTIPCVIPS